MFAALDPYVRYSLIGLLSTFGLLTLVACYLCVARRRAKAEETNQYLTEMHTITSVSTVTFDADGNRQQSRRKKTSTDVDSKVYGDEYYDESDDDLELSKIHKMHKSLEYDANVVAGYYEE